MLTVISTLWSLYLIVLAVWIIWRKHSPAATLGWILALAMLPYIGFAVYYFFGPQRIERRRLRREETRQALAWFTRMHTRLPELPTTEMLRFVRLGVTACGLFPGTCTNVRLLVDGGETYETLFAAIRAAKRHVHLEYYIFEPDRIGTALRDLLTEKAKEGVTVRLLVDALGSKRLSNRFLAPLTGAGGKVGFFHPVSLRRLRPVINMRTHRKIVVCDDWTGFTGGINITDEEDERVNDAAYHDVHLLLHGDAVQKLQQTFWEDWLYSTGEMPPPEALPAPAPALGQHIVQIVTSGPDSDWAGIQRMHIAAIYGAQYRVWLTTPYFVPDEAALTALTNAALRGVDVRVLVPQRSDSLLVTLAARSYFDELTEAGVDVYEYVDGMLHSKTLVVDETLAMVGTANFDNRSFRLNFEVSAVVYGDALAQTLARQFEEDLAASRPVLKQRNVSRLAYFGEAAARLASPLL